MKTLSATHELDSLLAHKEWLFRLARHLVHGDHAEDVAQETWVAALRSPPEPGRPPRPWLAEVLRNFVRKRARTEMRRSGREAAVGEMATTSASPEELYERVEQQQRLVERVMALEEPERRIVLMRYFEDRSATEIAQHLGIPAGTVRWRLKEALEGLRHQLDREHGGDRRAWGALLLPMAGALPSVPKAADTKAALEAGTKALAQGNSWAVAKAVAVAAVIVIVVGGIHVARRPAARPTVKPDVAAARARFLPFDGLARPASAVIARGIVHAPDGTSVAGAMVSAVRVGEDGAAARQPPVSVVSDRDGRFGFSLAPGSYVLAATAPRFAASAGVGVEARDGQSPLETRLTLRPDGFVLSGAAVDSGGGFIPNAELRVRLPDEGWAVVRADLSGALAVRLPRGEYQFVVAGDGYAPLRGSVSLIGDQERSFRLDPAGRISGRVVNQKASGDARAAGAMVRADRVGTPGEPEMAVADDEGNFGFSALNPGTYRISAAKDGAIGQIDAPVAVTATGRVEGLVVSLAEALAIQGDVRTKAGVPVAGAKVCLEEAIRLDQGMPMCKPIAVTNDKGAYRIAGVAPGRFRVAARAEPHAPSLSATVTVKDRTVSQVNLTLPPGGMVLGRVLDPDGRPVDGAQVAVSIRDKAGSDSVFRGAGRARSDHEGRFSVGGLGAGALEVNVDHAAHGTAVLTDVLPEGERKPVTVSFAAPAFVEGRVDWDDGTPAARARVRWIQMGGHSGRETLAMTDVNGRFRLGPIAPGTGVAQAELSTAVGFTVGGLGPDKKQLTLKAGHTERGIVLLLAKPDKTISGTVVGPDGAPVPDVRVAAFKKMNGTGRAWRGSEQGQSSITSADGAFAVTGLPKGKFLLATAHPQFADSETENISAGSTRVRLQLYAGATLAGVAVDHRGQPAVPYTAVLLPAESPGHHNGHGSGFDVGIHQTVRDPRGEFRFEKVAPGDYDVIVTSAAGGAGRLPGLRVGAGASLRDLRVSIGSSVTVTGRLVAFETGEPVADVGVGIGGTKAHVHARTDAEGRYTIDRQVAGRTLVLFVRARDRVPEFLEFTLPTGVNTFEVREIRLLPLSMLGVRRGEGHPGFTVWQRGAPATIDRVFPDSPAARAGLRAGDRLSSIDGTDVTQWGSQSVALRLIGDVGSPITLGVESHGARRTVTIPRIAIDRNLE